MKAAGIMSSGLRQSWVPTVDNFATFFWRHDFCRSRGWSHMVQVDVLVVDRAHKEIGIRLVRLRIQLAYSDLRRFDQLPGF